jgi:CheY-like chemotaxis protein
MDVLIVEDDKVLSLLLTKMVEKIGLSVAGTASSGKKALETAIELSPDLILMDIMLEDDIDGIDVMNSLRAANHDFPVIYITGNSDLYNRERAVETNYVEYLIKPISFDQLKDAIAKVD